MKKLFLIVMTTMMSIFVSVGCENKEKPIETHDVTEPSESESTNTNEVEFDEVQFMEDIKPNIDLLDMCYAETFGADVNLDYANCLIAAYKNGEIALLYPANEWLPEGYDEDMLAAMYYPVANYDNLEDLIANLQLYIEYDKIPCIEYIEDDFLEFDNQLYLCRGGRGYHSIGIDPETAQYLDEEDGKQVISIDLNNYRGYDHTEKYYFVKNADGYWQIVDIVPIQ